MYVLGWMMEWTRRIRRLKRRLSYFFLLYSYKNNKTMHIFLHFNGQNSLKSSKIHYINRNNQTIAKARLFFVKLPGCPKEKIHYKRINEQTTKQIVVYYNMRRLSHTYIFARTFTWIFSLLQRRKKMANISNPVK